MSNPQIAVSHNSSAIWGPKLWSELHQAANDGTLTPEWLANFAHRIPCPICLGHWLRILKTLPVDYRNPVGWAIQAHNAVNEVLEKPIYRPDAQPLQ